MFAANYIRIRCWCIFVMTVLTLQANAQELVTNGGFEEPVLATPWIQRARASTFGGWTVDDVGQGVAQVGSFGNPHAIQGTQCVELNFYNACGISQSITTQPAARYLISFMMAGQTNMGPDVKTMRVEWEGGVVAVVGWSISGSGGQWQPHSYIVTATGASSTVHFFGEVNVDGGPYLDAVSVMRACSADFNNDQVVDFFDYLDFVSAMSSQDPAADFNNDSIIDFFDYLDFVQAFSEGC